MEQNRMGRDLCDWVQETGLQIKQGVGSRHAMVKRLSSWPGLSSPVLFDPQDNMG